MSGDDSSSNSLPDRQREAIKETLAPKLVAEPLKSKIANDRSARQNALTLKMTAPSEPPYEVIIELNLDYPGGRPAAREFVLNLLKQQLGEGSPALSRNLDDSTHPYVFATLTAEQICELVDEDGQHASQLDDGIKRAHGNTESPVPRRQLRSIFRIWESQKIHPLITESIKTVKANAAHNAFGAFGEGIVWAVLDSGVDKMHPHFALHQNLDLPAPLTDKSCTFIGAQFPWDKDAFGHGTHVAGIIAGEAAPGSVPQAAIQASDEAGGGEFHLQPVAGIKGMAPKCKLLILRVLDDNGNGDETALIQAIEYVQKLNDYGRSPIVHGINISAGFPSNPTWYACGQTPLCVEINRLVKAGVAVTVAAGNSGHVLTALSSQSYSEAGQMMSVNDPGNAELAITVGSTHRQMPHTYGISFFSSKGPTSDGRRKPDVVAPGEKIISAASSDRAQNATLPGIEGKNFSYIEDTGTSMAAPHVAGVLAAFLSIQREFIGQPEKTKALLAGSAIDLGRDPDFQGSGLIDLMKLIQSV